jgi:uncharacterized protein (DUF2252 family)
MAKGSEVRARAKSLPEPAPTAPRAERAAAGRARRAVCAREKLGEFSKSARDPITIIEISNAHRLPELIPIRYGRMAHSPFTFYRGAAALMAHDIAACPSPGICAQICGDAHLGNFGGFASPERALLFGLNDFDETTPGAFEWDLKRLAASFHIAAREQSLSESEAKRIVLHMAATYRERMQECAEMGALELWYAHIDLETLISMAHSADTRQQRIEMTERALHRTSDRAYPKLVDVVDGRPRIHDNPPLVYHAFPIADFYRDVLHFWQNYVASMPEERRLLLARYELVDVAIKVVGVGSVGTRCAIALLLGGGVEPLFLQFKEADRSVYEPWAGRSVYPNAGQRVVVGQRIMQAASDIFLGWAHAPHIGADFYVRQLRDMKISLVCEHMSFDEMFEYANACGWALARAHAKGSDPAAIAGYLGRGDRFPRAMAVFARQYADQNEKDHQALLAAIKSGRVQADRNERGV